MHHRPKVYPATILATALVLNIASPLPAFSCEEEREFLVTAYYSPLPNQEHYYLGSYEADIVFNGRGIAGNDGTKVYPGMIAAPPEFPFGTRIALPAIDVVGTVHDRGGRITTDESGLAHIDLWMGEGEEGLARALAWGARTVKAIVHYPVPKHVPEEKFDLAQFPAPRSALDRIPSNPIALLNIRDPKHGDTTSEVAAIQHALQMLGYFDHEITNTFGDVTREALRTFQRDLSIAGTGEVADEATRRALVAHRRVASELTELIPTPSPEQEILIQGASGKSVRILQRLLALLSLYQGEIDGEYDQELMSLIFEFQVAKGIVQSPADTGAGMVGPKTGRALLAAWREYRIGKRGGTTAVASL